MLNAVSKLNTASFINHITAPNMAKYYVGALVAINGTTRIIAAEMDKKEKPSARHYAAGIAGLQEVFALSAHFLLTPLFAVGGLLLGRHLIAKNAFKCFKGLKLKDINKTISEIHKYNGKVLKNVRENIEAKKEIVIKKGSKLYTIVKETVKGKKDNIMDALEGNMDILKEVQPDKLPENSFVTTTLKFIDNNPTTHNNVIGSQKFGEAIGMTTALTIISPLCSIKLVRPLLEKLGLSKETDGKFKPEFSMGKRLKEQGFDYTML
ncbi:MAG: hypothetical protein A2Y25_04295 [Candidatus Melainabacteria bacterium GWF2_37_15]|nr:MAG: hypothetical protein A2Y25_04295 [Candidatus Melainabacteria bacterium GWF2_37_15]